MNGKPVIYDKSGWLTVDGPRFHAFSPLGSRTMREAECVFLAEAYGWDPKIVKAMSSSERHRFIKWKEEITRQQNASAKGSTVMSSTPTGIPTRHGPGERSVSVGYGSAR